MPQHPEAQEFIFGVAAPVTPDGVPVGYRARGEAALDLLETDGEPRGGQPEELPASIYLADGPIPHVERDDEIGRADAFIVGIIGYQAAPGRLAAQCQQPFKRG